MITGVLQRPVVTTADRYCPVLHAHICPQYARGMPDIRTQVPADPDSARVKLRIRKSSTLTDLRKGTLSCWSRPVN